METENNVEQTQSSDTEATSEQSSEETQQADSQSSEQEDTTQNDGTLTTGMAIEAKEESSETESTEPTIDDIVAEAMAGELSEETQKLVEANGLGKHLDMLVQGHRAIQEKNNQEVYSVVGGEESYGKLQEWGKENMSKEQQESFNKALFSGDMHLAKLAVQGLNAQFTAANGTTPDRVLEGGGSSASGSFSSVSEYIKITQSRQYKSNSEFRASTEAKRNKSGF